MSVSARVEGLKELSESLKAMESKTAKKDVRLALRAGAQVIANTAQWTAPHRTFLMGRSVVVRGGRAGGPKGTTRVTITYNKKLYAGKKGFYGDAVDQGHFAGGRIGKQEFHTASKSVNWSSDREVRAAQNVALYAKMSRAKGRVFIPGSNTLQKAAESKAGEAVEKFADTLRDLIGQ